MSVNINQTTKQSLPKLPYDAIKNDILGKRYELSLNFVGEKRGRAINWASRGKSYIPNVLSFPLHDEAGEIYITPAVVKRESKNWDHSYEKHTLYLYIHGLLHLKGYDHGEKMDSLEEKFLKKYSK